MSESPSLLSRARRVGFLDGLRGLSALYVVAHHAAMEVIWTQPHPSPVVAVSNFLFLYSQSAVGIFIVLSGYCLMLPASRAGFCQDRSGIAKFYLRRMKRILPPYYFVLAFCIAFIALVPALPELYGHGTLRDTLAPGPILSHVFMVHNVSADWIFKFDPPMWSLATEFQIYLLFPILLLPLWRRFGPLPGIALGFVVGGLVPFVFPGTISANYSFIGLFAVGMAAAARSFQTAAISPIYRRVGRDLFLAHLALIYVEPEFHWLHQVMLGASLYCLLISFAQEAVSAKGRRSIALRLLEARPVMHLGAFSYSLYLIHFPLLSLLHEKILAVGFSPGIQLVLMLALGIPISLAAGYLVFYFVERHFIPGHPRTMDHADVSTVVSPAP